MQGIDYLLIGIVAAILIGAGFFIGRAKKQGKKCIGCPDNCACSGGNCASGCQGQCHK